MAAPMSMSKLDWLYPDLLSKDGLIFVLKKRFIPSLDKDLETMDKESLVSLYNRYILPLPQRKYRTNTHRGRDMTKKQILLDKKKKLVHGDSEGNGQPQLMHQTSSTSVSRFTKNSPLGNRLKPPPSSVEANKKVVKLSSSGKTNASLVSTNSSKSDRTTADSRKRKTSTEEGVKEESNNTSPSKKISKITWP